MITQAAALGLYQKADKKNKVYYVNRKTHAFAVRKLDENGKPMMKTNPMGQPIVNSRGEPEYYDESIQFVPWQPRFHELGYWSVYEVTKETPAYIAKELAEKAKAKTSEIMDEEAFIKYSNPHMAEEMKRSAEQEKELEELRTAKTKADEEIARLKNRINSQGQK